MVVVVVAVWLPATAPSIPSGVALNGWSGGKE